MSTSEYCSYTLELSQNRVKLTEKIFPLEAYFVTWTNLMPFKSSYVYDIRLVAKLETPLIESNIPAA